MRRGRQGEKSNLDIYWHDSFRSPKAIDQIDYRKWSNRTVWCPQYFGEHVIMVGGLEAEKSNFIQTGGNKLAFFVF